MENRRCVRAVSPQNPYPYYLSKENTIDTVFSKTLVKDVLNNLYRRVGVVFAVSVCVAVFDAPFSFLLEARGSWLLAFLPRKPAHAVQARAGR